MKTVTEKTDELLEQLIYFDFRSEVDTDKAKKLVRMALREHGRDIRHACAEAVVDAEDPHMACMNAKCI